MRERERERDVTEPSTDADPSDGVADSGILSIICIAVGQ
jgi:hypothetical protein